MWKRCGGLIVALLPLRDVILASSAIQLPASASRDGTSGRAKALANHPDHDIV